MAIKKNYFKSLSGAKFLVLFSLFFLVFYAWLSSSICLATQLIKPEQIILTWTGESTSSQTITWLMSTSLTTQVQYVEKAEGADNFAQARKIQAKVSSFGEGNYRHSVDITNLKPDTDYLYRVGGEGFWSEILSFRTAANTADFSFLYMGDVQEGYKRWADALNFIYRNNPEVRFSLIGGDLTNNGNDEKEWGEFLNAASTLFSHIPLMPTLGNHDGIMYKSFFALPANGTKGLEGGFYVFDYGNAHFVVLNSNNNMNEKAKEWLKQDLQKTDKTWKFALFHHPAYPAYDDRKGIAAAIRNNWVPLLEEFGVDLVFVGHQHQYMRTHKIWQGEVQKDLEKAGIIYIMGNVGSKKYAFTSENPYIAREKPGSNYQVITIKANQLDIIAKTIEGQLIEQITINKPSISLPLHTLINADNYRLIGERKGFNALTYSGKEAILFCHLANMIHPGLLLIKPDYFPTTSVQLVRERQ